MAVKPKILYITSYDLDGPDNGGTLRNRHLVEHLSHIGDVNILLASDFEMESPKAKTNGGFPLVNIIQFRPTGKWSLSERLCNEFDGTFLNTDRMQASDADRESLQKQIVAHDLIWIHTLKLANRFGRWRWPATVLDIDDIPSSLCRSNVKTAQTVDEKIREWRQTILWRRREKYLLERFDAVSVCSDADCEQLGGGGRIFVLPNGFSIPARIPMREPMIPARIGFIGNFKHVPNRDGIDWFARHVWPLVLKKNPDARLRLSGADADGFHKIPNVDVLGWTEDMEKEMATWSLSVVPVRIGGGTRVKIAEAFSRKCPIVSTTLGAYGYEVADGCELQLADSPKDFAAKCLYLLENPSAAEAMAERAWKKFLQQWTWDSLAGRIPAVVKSVLQKRAAWKMISEKNFAALRRTRPAFSSN
jgi:glycosyltransferase involved in cell wall biosynthesis